MSDCLRSFPLSDFKWAAIEQGVITTDANVVFNILQSLGHCAKDKLKQLTRFTTRRLDKALNPLLVYEKVVRVNGELVFVPLPPELERLVAAQAHATSDEEVEALCAAPAPDFAQDAVSTTSTTPDATADQPCASDSEVVTEPKANLKSSAQNEAMNASVGSSESVVHDSDERQESVPQTDSSLDDDAMDAAAAVEVDTLDVNASAETQETSVDDTCKAKVAPEKHASSVSSDSPVGEVHSQSLATKVATGTSALHAAPVSSSLPVSQSAVVTKAVTEEQSASKAEVSGVYDAEPVVQPKAAPEAEDIPVLQAEPIEAPASANVANGQQPAMVVNAQSNESQTMAYGATSLNSAAASQKQGFAYVNPSASAAAVVVTNSTVVSVAVSSQVPANGSPNQNFAPVPSSGTQPYKSQFAVPQQYQSQFAAPSAPAMQPMQPACDQVGNHPRDIQEVIDYIRAHPEIYSHLIYNPTVDIVATAAQFYVYYENRSWKIGDSLIRNWTAVLYRAAGTGVDAKGNRRGWAITYVDAADVEAEQNARDLSAQANQANAQGTFAQMQHQSQQSQQSQSSLQNPALCHTPSQPLPLGQLSAMRAQQAVFNDSNGSYKGQQSQWTQTQSPQSQWQGSQSQFNPASSDSAGMNEFSADEYYVPQIIDTPEWLALDSEHQKFINSKIEEELGEPPKIENYPHYPNGKITDDGNKAFKADFDWYAEVVNRSRPQYIQRYKDVPIDQLI